MDSKSRKRRLSSVVLAILIWLGIGLSTPVLVHLTSSTLPFRDAVVAAQANSYTLVRPLHIQAAPLLRVDRGTILLTDSNGKPINNTHAASILSAGNGTLALESASVQFGGSPPAGSDDESLPIAPLAEALTRLRAETLILRRSTLAVTIPGGSIETLYGVDASISMKRKGTAMIRGKGALRGQEVTFELTTGLQPERRAGQGPSVPLKGHVRGTFLDLQFDGRAEYADGLQLDGQGEVSTGSVRQFARWFGAYWPPGPGMKSVAIRGQLGWKAGSVSFNRATTRIDGNEATGALELTTSQVRPLLSGTLAFAKLDLSPFVRHDREAGEANPGALASLFSAAFSVPLGGLVDADIRLSSERVSIDGVDLGSSAATVSLKDGRLLADIAELQVGSGRGAVQIRADLTTFKPKLSLRGKIDSLDLARLVTLGSGRALLQAPGSLVLDLTATGSTAAELARSVSGRINVRASEPGRLGLDVRRLPAEVEHQGWAAVSRGTMVFDTADVKLIARDGVLITEVAEIRNVEGTWAATGLVNLGAGRIDLRLTQVSKTPKGNPQPAVIEIRGPWAQPTIRATADPGSASAPDLPEADLDAPVKLLVPSRG